uniref:Protein Rev n=1 Tax=Simian immunodeficiency virus TaxID=11723 RepID=Q88103_SIV|nr:rev [Simian immunodeficiency virus]
MPLGPEERKVFSLIAYLNRTNPYPPVEGTARQRRRARRRWRERQRQLRFLAERIWNETKERQLEQTLDQLALDVQHLAIQHLPDPPNSS